MNRQPASAPEAARIVLKFSVWELMLILLFSILLGAFFVRIGFYPWTALPLILLCVSALNFAVADSFSQLYLLSLCTAKRTSVNLTLCLFKSLHPPQKASAVWSSVQKKTRIHLHDCRKKHRRLLRLCIFRMPYHTYFLMYLSAFFSSLDT